jgi:hypothetical protein
VEAECIPNTQRKSGQTPISKALKENKFYNLKLRSRYVTVL